MSITLELPPEVEASLRERAAACGQDIGDYLRELALRDVRTPVPHVADNAEEWEGLADELADTIEADVPPLSDDALSRESIYEGRP